MFYYWFRIFGFFLLRFVSKPVDLNSVLKRTFRVRFLDSEAARLMTAFRYPAYMDLIRWEQMVRSNLFHQVILKGLAPSLGSQKIIYRRPLKIWSKFTLSLEIAGWDDKWIYHIHRFEQDGQITTIGITKALIWKKNKPQVLREILKNAGIENPVKDPPQWVLELFKNDSQILGA